MIPALCPCVSLASLLICKIETQTKRDCKQDLSGILCRNYLGVALKCFQIRPLEFLVPLGQSEFMYQASYGPIHFNLLFWPYMPSSSNCYSSLFPVLASNIWTVVSFLLKQNMDKMRMNHGNNIAHNCIMHDSYASWTSKTYSRLLFNLLPNYGCY